jgi:hypothetical protein
MRFYNPSWKKRIRPVVMIGVLFLLFLSGAGSGQERQQSSYNDNSLARLKPSVRNGLSNGLWKYDAYPNLESLDAHKTVTIANIKGPAQINTIHVTAQMGTANVAMVRSVVLEVFFDDTQPPAVSVPLGDFFADGTGRAGYFSTSFVEKTPDAYNCYIPMPFKKSARVTLRNDSDRDIMSYSYVEWQTLPDWGASLGYLHASWQRLSFQLTPDTTEKLFSLRGPGHLIGEYWNINTDEPEFTGMGFVMEGNNEFRVDEDTEPSINYLGSEDSFNFSWGWHHPFDGYKVGINYLSFRFDQAKVIFEDEDKDGKLSRLSTYRFRDRDAIHFDHTMELTVNWTKEFRFSPAFLAKLDKIRERNHQGAGWVDYAVTPYWYSSDPKGRGLAMPPIGERLKPVLHKNSPL